MTSQGHLLPWRPVIIGWRLNQRPIVGHLLARILHSGSKPTIGRRRSDDILTEDIEGKAELRQRFDINLHLFKRPMDRSGHEFGAVFDIFSGLGGACCKHNATARVEGAVFSCFQDRRAKAAIDGDASDLECNIFVRMAEFKVLKLSAGISRDEGVYHHYTAQNLAFLGANFILSLCRQLCSVKVKIGCFPVSVAQKLTEVWHNSLIGCDRWFFRKFGRLHNSRPWPGINRAKVIRELICGEPRMFVKFVSGRIAHG